MAGKQTRDGAIVVDDNEGDELDPTGAVDPDDAEPDDDDPDDDDGNVTIGRVELDKMRAALAKNNREQQKRRHLDNLLKQHDLSPQQLQVMLEQQGSGGDSDPDGGEGGDPPAAPADPGTPADPQAVQKLVDAAVKKATRALTTEAERRQAVLHRALAAKAVEAALRGSGWRGTDLDRVMKLVDLDEIELDDDGEVTGAAEQVDGLKTEFPEWFRAKREPVRRGAADVDGQGRGRAARQQPGWEHQIVDRWQRGE